MDVLREIYDFVNDHLRYDEHDWALFSQSLSQLENQLLDGVKDKSKSEEEIAYELYRVDSSYSYFRTLKRDLRRKLGRLVLHYNPYKTDAPNFRRAYHDAHQKFATFNSLRGAEKSTAAYGIASVLIRQTIKYDLTTMNIELSKYLARHYSTRGADFNKAVHYKRLTDRYLQVAQKEAEIEWIFNLIASAQNANTLIHNDVIVFFESNTFDEYLGSFSYTYPFIYGLSAGMTFTLTKDYSQALEIFMRLYHVFEQKKYDHQIAKAMLLDYAVRSHINLGQLTEAQQSIPLLLKYVDSGRNSWFLIQDTYVRLCIAQDQFEEALGISDRLVKHKNFINQSQYHQELWMLYRLYLDILVRTGHIPDQATLHKKSINKFFRTNKILLRDKEGSKVAYIILELLYYVLDKDYDAIEMRIASLKDYCSVYLKKQHETYRSNCFIKMLFKIPLNNFHPVAADRKASLFKRKLSEVPFSLANQNTTLELIPYEKLWEIILAHLKTPYSRRKPPMDKSHFMIGRKGN